MTPVEAEADYLHSSYLRLYRPSDAPSSSAARRSRSSAACRPASSFPRRRPTSGGRSPSTPADARDYGANYLSLVGRVVPGVSDEQTRDAVARFAAERAARDPRFPKAYAAAVTVAPLGATLVGASQTTVLVLFAAVGCVLLVACANIASLLLARASARREFAVRSALGAARLQLLRQLVVESLVLALAGCAAGLAVAQVGIRAIAAGLPPSLPGVSSAGVDGRALAFSLAVSCLTALAFGLVPALDLSRTSPGRALESGARTSGSRGSRRVRRLLVVAEIALAVVLVTGAGLLQRSLWRMTHVDPGFAPDRLLTLRTSVSATDRDAVRAAGAIHLLPMTPGNWDPDVRVEGRPVEAARRPPINWRAATPDYFRAMQIPVVRGRLFTEADERGDPVTVINQAMADLLFAGEDPIGRRVSTFFEGAGSWARIVGVVGNVRQHGPAARPRPEMYRPLAQHPLATLSVVIESEGAPERLAQAARRAIAEVDPDAPVWNVMPMREVMGAPIELDRFLALLLTAFAGAALGLGAIGVFSVISYDVAQETPQIGVRLALGADPARARRGVLVDALRLTAGGVAIGLAAALVGGRLVERFLFGVSPADPATLAIVPAILAAVSMLAAYVPAKRAAAVDPIVTLRGA